MNTGMNLEQVSGVRVQGAIPIIMLPGSDIG
jgi:hypothetical protein